MHRVIVKLQEEQIYSELSMWWSLYSLHGIIASPLRVGMFPYYSAILHP